MSKDYQRSINVRALLLMCLVAVCLQAGQWWETKNYQEWSIEEAKWVFNNSPWAAAASAGIRHYVVAETAVADLDPQIRRRAVAAPVLYRIRLFTARPIREASLRLLALGQFVKTTVGVKEITQTTTSNPEQQATVDQFAPDDDKCIIIAVALSVGAYGSPLWIETAYGNELSVTDVSKLKMETKLTTNTGKIANLLEFEPSNSFLGAQFYFLRNLPNGQPFVSLADKELSFETRMNGHRIRVNFKLKKMLYQGKLEM